MFKRKCLYCKGSNLYIQRTSPMLVYGCEDCQQKTKMLLEKGFTKQEAERFIKHGK